VNSVDIHNHITQFFFNNNTLRKEFEEDYLKHKNAKKVFTFIVETPKPFLVNQLAQKVNLSEGTVSRWVPKISDALGNFSIKYAIYPWIELIARPEGKNKGVLFFCGDASLERVKKSLGNVLQTKQVEKDKLRLVPKLIPRCLSHIEKMLDWKIQQEAKWFRREGPRWIDFDKEHVYLTDDCGPSNETGEIRIGQIKELQNFVMKRSVSLLEGEKATGKTVLLLSLGYKLYKDDKIDVYYFDVPESKNFKQSDLIDDMTNTDGVVIIDNIHRAWDEIQGVYAQFKHDISKHILFAARPPYRESKYSFAKDLTEIDKLKLSPYREDANDLINQYAKKHNPSIFTSENCLKIRDKYWQNLWLVSYALKGCKNNEAPENWVKDGVISDLKYLDSKRTAFPEIVIAIAPLYKNEVLTETSFLTNNLGFKPQDLYDLYQLGEIRRQESDDGFVFYGLHHSVLADAYWEYGKFYRKTRGFKEYEDFVYNYAASYPSNGLEAVIKSINGNICYCNLVAHRLYQHSKLAKVIENETSFSVMWKLIHRTIPADVLIKHEIQAALAKRIETSGDFCQWIDLMDGYDMMTRGASGWGISLEEARRIWTFFDKQKLALSLSQCSSSIQFYRSVSQIFEADQNLGFDVVNSLNTTELKTNLEHDPVSGNFYVDDVCRKNPEHGQEFLNLLRRRGLLGKAQAQ